MRESWRSQRPREMLFDGTIGRAHNQLSSLRLLRYPLGLIFAGGSFVLSLLLLIAGALLARPQAAIQGGAAAAPINHVKAAHSASEKPVDFNRDIRPILSDACFTCHGPEEKSRQGNLRLDIRESAFAEHNGYSIIVPGSSATSRLYQKISSKDNAFRMPPAWSGRSLTPKQIELFRQWIDQGAKWQSHWAFDPPKRSAIPEVKDKTWPKNPI